MGAILNVDVTNISKDEYAEAERLIERNRLRQQVALKQALLGKTDIRNKELLYKMICDDKELKRWGIKPDTNQNNQQIIEIKATDPEIINKVKNL